MHPLAGTSCVLRTGSLRSIASSVHLPEKSQASPSTALTANLPNRPPITNTADEDAQTAHYNFANFADESVRYKNDRLHILLSSSAFYFQSSNLHFCGFLVKLYHTPFLQYLSDVPPPLSTDAFSSQKITEGRQRSASSRMVEVFSESLSLSRMKSITYFRPSDPKPITIITV